MSQAITMRRTAGRPGLPAILRDLGGASPGGDLVAKAEAAYGGGGSDYVSPVPGRLRVLRAAALAALTAWAAVTGFAVHSVQTATRTVGFDAAPSVVAAEKVRSLLADANGNFANVLLVRDADDGPFASAFRQDMRDAQTALAAAAGNVTYGDEERGPILTLMRGVVEYADLVGQARASVASGDRASLEDAKAADALMHFTLLPAAAALERANHVHLSEGYDAHAGRIVVLLLLSGALALAALAAIGLLQVQLARSTRRLVDPFAAGAMAVLALGAAWALASTVRAEASLRVAKSDAFESFSALATAQAYANDANASESFWLLAPADGPARTAYADAFASRAKRVWAYPPEAKPAARDGLPGLLGAALGNVTFPGEKEALTKATDAWTAYLAADRKIRDLSAAGKRQEAVTLCVGTGEGQSNWAFARFVQALEQAISINREAFDANVAASGRLAGPVLLAALAAAWLVACLGAWLAAARRLRAYEF